MNDREPVYFEYVKDDGTIKREFEPEAALIYLLENRYVFLNNCWWKKDWPEDATKITTIIVNCNDVFDYATADGIELNFDELQNLYDHIMLDERYGAIAWCIKNQRQFPIQPYIDLFENHPIWGDEFKQLFNEDLIK